jgi:hypothetical protein
MACGPSARLEDDLPESRSIYADEGTFLHNLTEACLRNRLDVAHLCGVDPWEKSDFFTKENQEAAQFCVDAVREAQKELPGAIAFYEQRLDFSNIVPEGFGTGDVVLVGDDTIWAMDHKFGRGIRVDAQGNPQGRLYLLGALAAFEELGPFKKARFTVLQPKLDNVSTEELTIDELMAWADEVIPLADRAFAGEGEFNPGDWCQFCRAKAQCTARSELAERALIAKFPAPDTLPIEYLAARLPLLQQAKAWINDVEEHLLKEACRGIALPGLKLVEGRSNRTISDPVLAKHVLNNSGYTDAQILRPSELITLTQLEKLVGKKVFANLLADCITKPAGKPVLASASDKRPEIAATALAFETLDS